MKIYGQKDCAKCDELRAVLDAKDVHYEYIDLHDQSLDKEEAAHVMSQVVINGGQLPIVALNDSLFSFDNIMKVVNVC